MIRWQLFFQQIKSDVWNYLLTDTDFSMEMPK